ncbi:KxYKxGKxW signal peptide domain-containing protein [Lacticaseibacillus pabuli]|uniref:KxYKxGKxW signal peptide domain-containing protein n=1 Tax=Lacticaseibacillus pabuli TaxID=3025672 RepID=A0ABY7WST3_9LACO|nr:KxYKxGKxW signal peptide domain-containing protein [Lacticaseibacillus sp. KACC 23028]WDF83234.1 KxYKxGKxW signal peptide domain-containing protein [Lacticaseibacillus sp. KACC 23028]
MSNQNKLFQATLTDKRHYKMYKAGKRWLVAGISLLFAGALALAKPNDTAAATATTTDATTVTAQATDTNKTSDAKAKLVVAPSNATADTQDSAKSVKDDETATAKPDTVTMQEVSDKSADAQADQNDTEAVNDTQSEETNNTNQPATQPTDTATPTPKSPVANEAATSAELTKSTPDNNNETTSQDTTQTDLGAATADQIAAAKAQAKDAYLTTGKPQKITAADGDPADATASVTLSANNFGYQTGNSKSFTITFAMSNTHAGDVFTINLPADNMVAQYDSFNQLPSENGTSDYKQNDDGTRTIVNTFATNNSGITTQTIKFNLVGNDFAQKVDQAEVGTTTHQITWKVNKDPESSTSFTTTVTPKANLQPIKRESPTNSVAAILPKTDYVYEFDVNESDGVFDDGAPAKQVNSAINSGTTITIPVPTGFTLNAALTAQMNSDKDGTITQAGGAGSDITIVVPAGQGKQEYSEAPGYKLVGAYAVAQTETDQVLTAAGPATMVQKVNHGAETLNFTGQTWQDTLLGTKSTTTVATSWTYKGNSSNNSSILVLDADPTNDPATLLSYGFAYESPATTNQAKISMTIPDGFDATAVSVPVEGATPSQYLPGTTSYQYEMTLADGTVETGTVAAGGKATSTSGSAIRSIVFTPNTLAAGAKSDDMGTKGSFQVYGTLASHYDNNTPVKTGDKLTSFMSVDAPGTEPSTDPDKGIMQTVEVPFSSAHLFNYSPSKVPGQGNGYLSIYGAHPAFNQTTNQIFEPILYYVLPKSVTPTTVTGTQDAKVTRSVTPDGRVIVTIDYTGTGESVDLDIGTTENNRVNLVNNPDALSGHYQAQAYIYSPTTALAQTTKVEDPSLTGGHADAVIMSDGTVNLDIDQASSTYTATLAQGDDVVPVQQATLNNKSTNAATFQTNIVNTNGALSDVTTVLNLPTIGDNRNSQYTFDLDGPITVPTDLNTVDNSAIPANAQVTYSMTRTDFTTATTAGALTGFVTANQVASWKDVRSIKITLPSMPTDTSTGRITLKGTIEDMTGMENKTGRIESALYLQDVPVAVTSEVADASLKVIGTSTIKARVHYKDEDGADQYIAVPVYDQTYTDGTDTVKLTDFPATLPNTVTLPSNYELDPDATHFVEGSPAGTTSATAKNNTVVTGDYNGDWLQYELNPQLVHGKAQTTRQIVYAVDGGTASAPAPVIQTVNWNTTTNLVTGETISTPQQAYYTVVTPNLAGYTASQDYTPQLAVQAVAGMPTNAADVYIAYQFAAESDPQVRTQVTGDESGVNPEDYFDYTAKGEDPDTDPQVRTQVTGDEPSVTSDDYYDYTAKGEDPDTNPQVRTQIPGDTPSVTSEDYYDYTAKGEDPDTDPQIRTQIPGDTPSVTSEDYYDYTAKGEDPDTDPQIRTQIPGDTPSVTSEDYYDYTAKGEDPDTDPQVRTQVPDESPSVTPDKYYDNTIPPVGLPDTDGGLTDEQPTNNDDTTPNKELPDTFGGDTDSAQPSHGLPDTFGGSTDDRATQHESRNVALGNRNGKRVLTVAATPQNNQKAKDLPQTGDTQNTGLIALGLALLAGLMGLAGKRRREN